MRLLSTYSIKACTPIRTLICVGRARYMVVHRPSRGYRSALVQVVGPARGSGSAEVGTGRPRCRSLSILYRNKMVSQNLRCCDVDAEDHHLNRPQIKTDIAITAPAFRSGSEDAGPVAGGSDDGSDGAFHRALDPNCHLVSEDTVLARLGRLTKEQTGSKWLPW